MEYDTEAMIYDTGAMEFDHETMDSDAETLEYDSDSDYGHPESQKTYTINCFADGVTFALTTKVDVSEEDTVMGLKELFLEMAAENGVMITGLNPVSLKVGFWDRDEQCLFIYDDETMLKDFTCPPSSAFLLDFLQEPITE
ncbi:hypothetical protein CPC16_006138 [Podila verticillata]|nr:hypothetical protein CPC16_006138 [Podila verticillata]